MPITSVSDVNDRKLAFGEWESKRSG